MREIRPSGSEGGGALKPLSLPLSQRAGRSRTETGVPRRRELNPADFERGMFDTYENGPRYWRIGIRGGHVIAALARNGIRPRCLVRKTSRLEFIREWPPELVFGDGAEQRRGCRSAAAGGESHPGA